MTKYKLRKDGEGFTVPCGAVYRLACCDCGLVHDFVFVSDDGKPIGMAARRNERATSQRRRNLITAEKKAAAEKAHSAATEVMRAAMERAFSKAGKP